jgi:ABC-2 type transport system ATP-binding protein
VKAVACRDVVRRFDALTAVDEVTLEVEDNEIFGIIGPNGAGKTTLLNCFQGMDSPTSGEIEVLGLRPLEDHDRLVNRIGVQLQSASLLPRLTVAEVLDLFSSFYPSPLPWRPLVEQLGILSKRKSLVTSLSGGQRQRVFIVLALLHDPELVFLDELTTALDPQARLAMWDVVKGIRERGKTVVLTTHYMEEAEKLCDRIAIIDHGKIIAMDTVAALIDRYAGPRRLSLLLDRPASCRLDDVDGVTGTTCEGRSLLVQGDGPFAQQAISQLTRDGFVIQEMDLSSPSLEDVFLNLTGRSIREDS